MTLTPWEKQINNRHYLSPLGFKFSLAKYPKIDFLSNTAQIPGINLGVAMEGTWLKDIPIPGDKLTLCDFHFFDWNVRGTFGSLFYCNPKAKVPQSNILLYPSSLAFSYSVQLYAPIYFRWNFILLYRLI